MQTDQMDVVEFLIIYLACGAPFGVYHATSRFAQPTSLRWLKTVWAFVAWPVSVAILIARRLGTKAKPRREEVENIRQQIENAAFEGVETQTLFEFREVFYRFTGLADSLNNEPARLSGTELFDIAGRCDPTIALRCLARINRDRLLRHYAAARRDFLNLIIELEDESGNTELPLLARKLCSYINDPIVPGAKAHRTGDRLPSQKVPAASVRHA